jgi:hypothetical protein
MTRKHGQMSRNPELPSQLALRRAWGIGLLLLLVVAGFTGSACQPREDPKAEPKPASVPTPTEATTDPSPATAPATAEPANVPAPVVAKPDLSKLKGRWRRSGEQYVLEVRSIDESGKVEAAYFNPQPIRVGRALAKQQGGTVALFVELRDTGYPGCTYTLIYDAATDRLGGTYYQAAQQERYEVVFERIN